MKVIFFDGVCGTCNKFVDFIIRLDYNQKFKFSSLQSEFAKNNLPEKFTNDLKTIVYLEDNRLYSKSEAVLMILKEIKGFRTISTLISCLPTYLLNCFYDLFAKNRYKFFGKKEICRIPSPEERSRFID